MDNVVKASSQILKEVLLPQIGQILDLKLGQIKTELKQELIGTFQEMLVPLKQELDGNIESLKTPLKEELIGTFEEMKIPMKTEIKEGLTGTVEAMKAPIKAELQASFEQQIVSTSTSIVHDIIVPDMDQRVATKVSEIKDDLMSVVDEKLTGKVETMKAPLKTELVNTVEAMKAPLKAELQETFEQQIVSTSTSIVRDILVPDLDQKLSHKVDTLKGEVMDDLRPVVEEMNAPNLDTIVTASSTIINQVLVPQMEQKVIAKVNQIKEVVKDELKSELDQDLKAEMTQQIASKIIERQEEVDGKVIFAVARKSDVGPGTTITFDTVIANIGDSMNKSTGTFTTTTSGLYMFTFSALTTDTTEGGMLYVQVLKNTSPELYIEEGRTNMPDKYGNRNVAYSWMLQLTEGDTISLRVYSGTGYTGLHGCAQDWIYFSGQLLNAN